MSQLDEPSKAAALLRAVPATGELHVGALAAAAPLPPPSSDNIAALAQLETTGRARDPILDPYVRFVPPLEALVLDGRSLFVNLVGYRGLYRCIPKVPDDAARVKELHHRTVEVLRPNIDLISSLARFKTAALTMFGAENIGIGDDPARVPEEALDYTIELIDLLCLMDRLKEMRQSMTNDLMFYKRSVSIVKGQLQGGADEEMRLAELSRTIAGADAFFNSLVDTWKTLPNCEPVLLRLLQRCHDRLEHGLYSQPEEKHAVVRGVAWLFCMLDACRFAHKKLSVFADKELPTAKTFALLKQYPVFPVMGDVSLISTFLLKLAPTFDPDTAAVTLGLDADPRRADAHFMLANCWDGLRAEYSAFIDRWALLMNEITSDPPDIGSTYTDFNIAVGNRVVSAVLDGIKLLCAIKTAILEQQAVKYARPASDEALRSVSAEERGRSDFQYRRVTTYNYTADERALLADTVAMVKSLGAVLLDNEAVLAPLLRLHVFHEVQELAHGLTTNQLIKSVDKKNKAAEQALLCVRNLVAQWSGKVHIEEEYIEKGKKKKEKGARSSDTVTLRAVGPSWVQLGLLRFAIKAAVDPSSKLMASSLFSRSFFTDEKSKQYNDFARQSYFYPVLLHFRRHVAQGMDLSQLWMREMFIDRCNAPQFPVESSLPAMLVEHAVAADVPLMLQAIPAVLDVYNDAMNLALNTLSRPYLFDEMEAELAVVVRNLMSKLTVMVYRNSRDAAAAKVLAPLERMELERRLAGSKGGGEKGWSTITPPDNRARVLTSQRRLSLLGRNVDVAAEISSRVNALMREEVRAAFSQLDTDRPLSEVVFELDMFLAMMKEAHEHVVNIYGVPLEPWEELRSHCEPEGDSLVNVLFCQLAKLILSHSLSFHTNVFVPIEVETSASRPRKMWGPRFAPVVHHLLHQKRKYFGREHAAALLRIVGTEQIPVLFELLMSYTEEQICVNLCEFTAALIELPNPAKASASRSGFLMMAFESHKVELGRLVSTEESKGLNTVIQQFGNILALLYLLQEALTDANRAAWLASATLVTPDPTTGLSHFQRGMRSLTSAAEYAAASGGVMQLSADLIAQVQVLADRANAYCNGLLSTEPLLTIALRRIGAVLMSSGLQQQFLANDGGCLRELQAPTQYTPWSRLWSLLLFGFCHLPEVADMHGDGYLWGGTVLTYLLGQSHRLRLLDICAQVADDAAVYGVVNSCAVPPDAVTASSSFARACDVLRMKVESSAAMLGMEALADINKFVQEFAEAAAKVDSINHIIALCDPALPVPSMAATGGVYRPSCDTLCGDAEFAPPTFDFDDVLLAE